jgi:hypothetical protein
MARSRGFRIPVRAPLEAFQRDLRDMKEIGRRAATETADAILKEMKEELRKRQGALKEALAKGIIDKNQARQISRDFSKEFNAGILEALKQMRKAGKDNTEEFTKLQRSLRNVAETGTRTGKDIKRGFIDNLANLPSLIRGSLAVGVIGAFTFIANRVAAVFSRMAQGIRQTLERGGAVQIARQSFGELSISSGLDPIRTLEALRRAARSTASDLDLMASANLALQSGLPATSEQLGQLAEGARRLGRALGRDASESFERLIASIAKGERRLLDELGIVINFNEEYEKYARNVLGVTRELTENEKVAARLAAVLDGLGSRTARLGEDTLTAGDRMQQFAVFVENARNAMAEAIVESPKLAELFERIGVGAENSTVLIENLADHVGALVDLMIDRANRIATHPVAKFLFGFAKFQTKGTLGILGLSVEGAGFEEFLEQRRAARAAEQDLAGSRAEITKLVLELETLAARGDRAAMTALQQIADSQKEGAAAAAAAIGRLGRASGEESGDPKKAAREAARIAAERARLQEQLARELAQLTRSVVDESLLQLDKLEREWIAAFGRIDEETAAKFGSIRESIEAEGRAMEIEDQIRAYGEAHIEAAEDVVPLLNGLRALIDGIEAEADMLPEASKARERYVKLLQMAEKAMLDLAKAAEDEGKKQTDAAKEAERAAEERLRQIRDEARQLEEYARSAIQVAEALGLIDSEAAKTLESIAQLGAAIARVAGGDISAIPSLIGAGASLLSNFFGGDDERKEAIRKNTEAIDRLRLEFEGFQLSGGLLTGAQRAIEEIRDTGVIDDLISGEKGLKSRTRPAGRRAVEAFARQGISFAELKALAEDLGIELFDKEGFITSEGLEALGAALGIATDAVVGFGNSLDEQRAAREFEREVFDETASAAERAQDELDLLAKNAPDLFRKFFAGIDPSTAEGRAELEARTREVARLILTAELDPALLGDLTGEQLRELILGIDAALDEISEETGEGGATAGFQVQRVITEASANIVVAQLSSIELNTRRTYEGIYGLLTAAGGTIPTNLPVPAAPTTTSAQSAGISIGKLEVYVSGTQIPPLTTPGAQQELGENVAIGFRRGLAEEQTDHQMGNRTVNYRRAVGKLRG